MYKYGAKSPRFFANTQPQKIDLMKLLPKAELHVHLEGTMPPGLVKKMSEDYKVSLSPSLFSEDGKGFTWTNFPEFLQQYDEISSVVNSKQALTQITYEYLKLSHAQGSIYTELTVSPDHLSRFKVPYIETINAVEEGIKKAQQEFGIESRIIVVLVRHLGQKACEELVDQIIQNKHDYVCGIGLAGDEINFHPELFVNAFKKAKEAGLKLTAHAGELTNSDNVLQAIELLGVQRIGHGIHAAFDENLLQILKERNIHLEVCPTSNHKLQTRASYPHEHKDLEHPLTIIHEANVSYSLSTDDPPFFGTNLQYEYDYVKNLLNLKPKDLLKITQRAIEHSFAPESLKQQLLEKITTFANEHALDNETAISLQY
ncbi:adenosine deaminase [Legionella busanensis]|uniref:Adenosine deaminase n=1 Tax=Legionella busanensis TaxID=190655 RepID=A0A378JLY3_9GAMM|nr:adenosine deaminase [Legionella busanensis]STX51751.1 adenosine deaminase [Legionella busanensis]